MLHVEFFNSLVPINPPRCPDLRVTSDDVVYFSRLHGHTPYIVDSTDQYDSRDETLEGLREGTWSNELGTSKASLRPPREPPSSRSRTLD